MTGRRGTIQERFEPKVQKDDTGCWLWTGSRTGSGYGSFAIAHGKAKAAHRVAYELYVGPIPLGLEIDHICHNVDPDCLGGFGCPHRACVRPDHLRAVSHRENSLSGKTVTAINASLTHCRKGHPFDESNTYVTPGSGGRRCRTCDHAFLRRRIRNRSKAKS